MQLREFIHKEHLNAFMSMLSTTEVFGKALITPENPHIPHSSNAVRYFCAKMLDRNPNPDYNINPKSDYNTSHSGAQIKHRRFAVKNRRMIV